tara:strand:+ start:504 stop:617 length:114 start_codon:yes stop_codon:yes gene_type:complete
VLYQRVLHQRMLDQPPAAKVNSNNTDNNIAGDSNRAN